MVELEPHDWLRVASVTSKALFISTDAWSFPVQDTVYQMSSRMTTAQTTNFDRLGNECRINVCEPE